MVRGGGGIQRYNSSFFTSEWTDCTLTLCGLGVAPFSFPLRWIEKRITLFSEGNDRLKVSNLQFYYL